MIKRATVLLFCFSGLVACASNAAKDTHGNKIVFKDKKSTHQVAWDVSDCLLTYRSSKHSRAISIISVSQSLKIIDGAPNTFAVPTSLPKLHSEWKYENYVFKVVGEKIIGVQKKKYPVFIIERNKVDKNKDFTIKFLYNQSHGILGFEYNDGSTALVQKIPADIFLDCPKKQPE